MAVFERESSNKNDTAGVLRAKCRNKGITYIDYAIHLGHKDRFLLEKRRVFFCACRGNPLWMQVTEGSTLVHRCGL